MRSYFHLKSKSKKNEQNSNKFSNSANRASIHKSTELQEGVVSDFFSMNNRILKQKFVKFSKNFINSNSVLFYYEDKKGYHLPSLFKLIPFLENNESLEEVSDMNKELSLNNEFLLKDELVCSNLLFHNNIYLSKQKVSINSKINQDNLSLLSTDFMMKKEFSLGKDILTYFLEPKSISNLKILLILSNIKFQKKIKLKQILLII